MCSSVDSLNFLFSLINSTRIAHAHAILSNAKPADAPNPMPKRGESESGHKYAP
jgi:hypothetical protein